MTAEQEFETELELFRTEAQSGIQFLYAYLGIHAVLASEKPTLDGVNRNGLFWRTVDGAFHTSAFMTLGRIFDQKSDHNIDRLARLAQRNPAIFSPTSLEARKRRSSDNANEWVADFISRAYTPTADDFREMRRQISDHRKVFEAIYKPIRDKIYAHKEVTDKAAIGAIYERTNVDEMAGLLAFLQQVWRVLWELFHNGRQPDWSFKTYAVPDIVASGLDKTTARALEERIVLEARDVLRSLG